MATPTRFNIVQIQPRAKGNFARNSNDAVADLGCPDSHDPCDAGQYQPDPIGVSGRVGLALMVLGIVVMTWWAAVQGMGH